MDGKMLGRVAMIIILAIAMTAEAVHRAREDLSAAVRPSAPVTEMPPAAPLREALRRCQHMGEAATRDPTCLAIWDENRRRFLSPTAGN